MATQVIFHKLKTEELTLELDMLSRVRPGESISTAVVSIVVASGDDPSPGLMLSGLATVSNNVVSQKIIGGLPGVVYTLYISARTSLNNIVVNEAKLAVLSDGASTPP